MKTEILLLFFCLLNPKTEVAPKTSFKTTEAKQVVIESKLDMFSPLFLIEL
ncbi:MAG TPA: hypothetical protein VGB56_00310 [Flavisolibacter sp.]|jgi:hypothetical protein